MHALLVPILEPGFDLGGALRLLACVHFGEEKGELLSKSVEALPPMAAAVLVSVASEKVVEKLVNVDEHLFVML